VHDFEDGFSDFLAEVRRLRVRLQRLDELVKRRHLRAPAQLR
jgi:hypothetical protein